MLEKVFNQKTWSVNPFDEDDKKNIAYEFSRYMILSEAEGEYESDFADAMIQVSIKYKYA